MTKHSYRVVRVALVASALAFAAPAAFADQPHDAWITTKVKMGLLTAEQVDALGINVDTFDGRVTLHGQVESEAEKQQAEQSARKVEGVRDVRNLLSVVPAERSERAEVEDEELKRQVENVLERDQALAGSDIEVKSVNAGTVVLAGDAKTLSAHRRALEDARSVQGVRRVASEIESPDTLADEEIYAESPEGSAGERSGIGQAASDTWITTKAKVRLMAEPGLMPTSINVDTRNGIVTLFGTVGTQDVKEKAEAQIKQVQGVQRVENELQVVPDVAAERTQENDDAIEQRIEQALTERQALADAAVDVAVENGVVRLTGSVASEADRVTVLTIARGARGTKSVIDDLQQKGAQGSGD
jgi:hyperosmotically inducible protein